MPLRSDPLVSAQPSTLGTLHVNQLHGSATQEDNPSVTGKIGTPIADEFMAVKLSMKPSSVLQCKQGEPSIDPSSSVANIHTGLVPLAPTQDSFRPPNPPLMPPIPAFGFVPTSIKSSLPQSSAKAEGDSLASPRPVPSNASLAGEVFVAKLRNDAKEGKEKASSTVSSAGIAHPLSPAPALGKSAQAPQPIQPGQTGKPLQWTELVKSTQELKPVQSTEAAVGLAASRWAPSSLPTKTAKGNEISRRR